MAVAKFSVSFDAEVAAVVRAAAADEGIGISAWLVDAASSKARQHHLRAALDTYAAEHGSLSDADIDRLVSEAREGTAITGRRAL